MTDRSVQTPDISDDNEDDAFECYNPASHCDRCSFTGSYCVHHGAGDMCTRDPQYVVNVIADYFKARETEYMGIVWEAIANNVLGALGWRKGHPVTIDEMGRVRGG